MDEGELALATEVGGKVLEPGRGGGGGAAMGGTPPGGDQAARAVQGQRKPGIRDHLGSQKGRIFLKLMFFNSSIFLRHL